MMDRTQEVEQIKQRASDIYHSQIVTIWEWVDLHGTADEYISSLYQLAWPQLIRGGLDVYDRRLFRDELERLVKSDLEVV